MFQFAVAVVLVEQAGGVFVFAVAALFVGVRAGFYGALASGFVAGGPGEGGGGIALGDNVATTVGEVVAHGGRLEIAPPCVEQAADSAAHVGAALVFDGGRVVDDVRGCVFCFPLGGAEAAGEDEGGVFGQGAVVLEQADAARAVVVAVSVRGAVGHGDAAQAVEGVPRICGGVCAGSFGDGLGFAVAVGVVG